MSAQKILIADDDTKLVALLTSSLRKSGYETLKAFDGEAALKQARDEKPDLIIADIVMPKLDGFELCKRIREDPATAYIPFVFLTAKGELSDRVTGLNLGADDYISKPFHISEVVARIKAILQRVAAMSGGQDEGESALKGHLEQMGLAELMQTLGMNKKTGGLKIINESLVGKLFFNNGDIVKASLGGKYKNEEAIYRILSWDEGYFEFDPDDRADKAEIKTSTTSLLMEGFGQREDYLRYKKAMPPFDSVVKIKDGQQTDELKPTLRKIAGLIDGQRTIQDIVNISPINYILTVKALYTLLKKSIVEALELVQTPRTEEDYGQLADDLYE